MQMAVFQIALWRYRSRNPFGRLFLILALLFTSIASQAIDKDTEVPVIPLETHLSKSELNLWNDPSFKKQFVESYIAESEIEPRVTADEREQMQKVLDLISSDKMDKAAQILSKEISRNEAVSAVFDFTLGNIHFQQEKLDQAAHSYQIAVDKYPKFRRAWKNLGIIFIRRGEFEKALPALIRVIELGGNDAITLGLLGFAYASVDNFLSAESAYRMAILLDPETMDWKMGLARSFFKQQRFSEAAAICGQLLQDQPERADLWLLQANAFIGLNKPLKASKNYEIVEQLGQSTEDSLNMLGDIYVNEGLYDLAVDSFIRGMERGKAIDPNRLIRSAKVLIAQGAHQETQRLIAKIQSAGSDRLEKDEHKEILKLKARLAVAEGTGEQAIQVLEEIVALDPLDGEALILLGQNSERSGDIEKAIFYFERAANIEGFEADGKTRHAQLLVRNGKYDEALPLLRRAQQINHRDNVQKYLEQVERVARGQ